MKRRERTDDLRRRAPTRTPRVRILVVCEGRVTEPSYFKSFAAITRNPLLQVEISKLHGVPLTVVKTAIGLVDQARRDAKSQRDENLCFDEAWAVFDVDDHPRLAEAVDLADRNEILLAISSPSFELWPLLHFERHARSEHRDKIRQRLKLHLSGYDKELDAALLHEGYDAALERAAGLAREASLENERWRNPSTGVYLLTERIRSR